LPEQREAVDSQEPRCVRTLVVAQTRLYREGLARVLACDPRIDVTGTAHSIESGLAAIASTDPDAVLLDVGMASTPGIVCELLRMSPRTPVVAFGVADNEETVIRCAEAGIAGYVHCEASVDELVSVVVGAIRDEVVCTPRLAGTLLRRIATLARESEGDAPEIRLTSRETQILGLIDLGLSNKEIAARLQLSLSTVKNHTHNLLEKLGVSRRSEAGARARALRVRIADRIS
jgi:DNA-binding NarL/FixJ family response regulator